MDNKVMFKLSYGLFVLSARENGHDNACIINTAAQVTQTPNRITIAVNKQNLTHDMVQRTGVFNVSILDTTAPFALFRHFGFASGRDKIKLDGTFADLRAENGVVYLPENTCGYLSAKVVSTVDLGTHTLFLADVTDGESLSENPAVTYAYYQANIKPKPATPKKAVTGWRCRICGYVYEGEELPADFICPICKHGASDFEKIG